MKTCQRYFSTLAPPQAALRPLNVPHPMAREARNAVALSPPRMSNVTLKIVLRLTSLTDSLWMARSRLPRLRLQVTTSAPVPELSNALPPLVVKVLFSDLLVKCRAPPRNHKCCPNAEFRVARPSLPLSPVAKSPHQPCCPAWRHLLPHRLHPRLGVHSQPASLLVLP